MSDCYTKEELKQYIQTRINANNSHLQITRGTEYHEPEWYDGANTALLEMMSDFDLVEIEIDSR